MSVDGQEFLAAQFETSRSHLRSVAYRMLGSLSEADDAVQEAWLRLSRSDTSDVQNLRGWLTTVVARVCLDFLRSRTSRREDSLEEQTQEPIVQTDGAINPEEEAQLADSVGLALLVVLNTLTPGERLAFVLHEMFDVSFDEIAGILGRSSAAVRQLASRARRRVRGTEAIDEVDLRNQRSVVDAFLSALRAGDFEGLLAVLDPNVLVRTDIAGRPGAPMEIRGARNWAGGAVAFSKLAKPVQPALLNGKVGLVFAPGGRLSRAISFTIVGGKILEAEVIADPTRLNQLDVAVLSE